jgi:hypothetical protein
MLAPWQDVAFLRDSNLTHVRTYAVLEVGRLELEGSYRMEGRGGGAWAWLGADHIHSGVLFLFSLFTYLQQLNKICELF